MKVWTLMALLLFGCSSTKEKEFQKSLDKPEDADPKVQVEADAKILKKFEVEKIEEKKLPEAEKQRPVKKAPVKKVPAPVAAKAAPPVKAQLPKDYPADLIQLNEKAKKVWDVYVPNHTTNEKLFLDIHYLGMTVGKIMVVNRGKKMINGKEVWHFHSRFKSAPFYSSIYELDDTVDTYVTTDQFLSIRYSLIQRESKQDVDDLQLHDRDQLMTYWFYKQKKSDGTIRNKEQKKHIPYFSIDPFSVLFFYQGLPLKDGDVYEIPLINKAKMLILKSEVEGREEIKTELGEMKAIRIHATTQYTGETLKSGELYFWFSDDQHRKLLKAQAKIQLGSVTGDIVEN